MCWKFGVYPRWHNDPWCEWNRKVPTIIRNNHFIPGALHTNHPHLTATHMDVENNKQLNCTELPSLLLIFHNHVLKNSGLDLKLIVFFFKVWFYKVFWIKLLPPPHKKYISWWYHASHKMKKICINKHQLNASVWLAFSYCWCYDFP